MTSPHEVYITVELDGVEGTAAELIDQMKAGKCPHKRQAVRRWAASQIRKCHVWRRPPPASLVALIEHLLGADKLTRAGPKNRKTFREVARHVAEHPDATPRQVADAIEHDEFVQVRTWMERPDFADEVQIQQAGIEAEKAQERLTVQDQLLALDEAARKKNARG